MTKTKERRKDEKARAAKPTSAAVQGTKDLGRKLPSNWGRYEQGQHDDGTPECTKPKGRDFEELLNCAGGHFRYREEEGSFQTCNLLSLDCRSVSQALLTIALPQRLRLSTHLFPLDIYQAYEKEASSSAVPSSLSRSLSASLQMSKREPREAGKDSEELPFSSQEEKEEGEERKRSVSLENWLDKILDD